ncbi:hypothetical protein PanWU01x14_132060 [Parasponia andersonii]|uniref:Uncharacterized protein n=1 Tax=Parasponia andersonii TaxID=3476 RepID=A0A2P5CQL4_PARAD|nr:hypothetical protein PanWU01x14_132060 [Parasponia andersonii]
MIGVYFFRDPVSPDYVFPNEVNHVCLIDGCVGFSFYLFGEIVGCQQDIPSSPKTSGELPDNVLIPLSERPRSYVWGELGSETFTLPPALDISHRQRQTVGDDS